MVSIGLGEYALSSNILLFSDVFGNALRQRNSVALYRLWKQSMMATPFYRTEKAGLDLIPDFEERRGKHSDSN